LQIGEVFDTGAPFIMNDALLQLQIGRVLLRNACPQPADSSHFLVLGEATLPSRNLIAQQSKNTPMVVTNRHSM